ncbi:MAG: glutamate formimidoyltransferase [Acholeplasmataceae bacterium]|nr:glutamate formimidoyltransferase [Acholeplasmataceae bacterium]
MNPIIECVPNISEGKDIDKIKRIIKPLQNQEGFKLISYEPDKDYNRTVITLIGNPEMMIEPLIKFYENALLEIDLNHHQGEHPRMGAIDVCPFIPIQHVTMDDCILYAKKFGELVFQKFNIPVFLYAMAAQKPNRILLPDIRKGEFEGMKDKIKEDEWHPDFGTPSMHPTFGVAAIGARMPLIAFNIDLDTDNEKTARQIAKYIRGSSGGFQYVQAGPAFLKERNHVQVTMNILDYEKNSIYRIFELVQMEAKRFHVDVTSSEVVGLIPKDALLDSIKYYQKANHESFDKDMSIEELTQLAIKYLKLRDFNMHKIIEANL